MLLGPGDVPIKVPEGPIVWDSESLGSIQSNRPSEVLLIAGLLRDRYCRGYLDIKLLLAIPGHPTSISNNRHNCDYWI